MIPRNQQEREFTVGNDSISGGPGRDKVGYQFMDGPVAATGSGASAPNGTDQFHEIEEISLSRGNDTFGSPPAGRIVVNGMEGNDSIDVSGNPSPSTGDAALCGPGDDDFATVDAPPESGISALIPAPGTLASDAWLSCEHVVRIG